MALCPKYYSVLQDGDCIHYLGFKMANIVCLVLLLLLASSSPIHGHYELELEKLLSIGADQMLKYRNEPMGESTKSRLRRATAQYVDDVSDSPTVFESNELPMDEGEIDFSYMASVGNGHLSSTVYRDTIYVNGLYNDRLGVSHRARVPSKNAIRVSFPENIEQQVTRRYFLDVEQGVWHEEAKHDDFTVTVRIFAHRFYTRLLVTQIEVVTVGNGNQDVTVTLANNEGPESEDITFSQPEDYSTNGNDYKKISGETKISETILSETSTVFVYYTEFEEIMIDTRTTGNDVYNYITSIDQNDTIAQADFDAGVASNDLLNSHVEKWRETWDGARIEVDNVQLGKYIYGCFYYILSSLPVSDDAHSPKNQFYGLSPGGLANGAYLRDYQGHSFWDTETWMFPTVLMFHPSIGRDILSYRWHVREEARRRALCHWHLGTRYPWEGAFTGAEVTPDCCIPTRENQQHITSDVAFAARQYISATRDVEWLSDWGCDFTREIANFWQSRVTYNDERDAWEILGVMPPDEYHEEIDNSVYTNIGASLAIFMADYAACLCGNDPLPDDWLDKAGNMTYIFDSERKFHPEYEGYPIGEMIKQADVVLLGFPMMWEMTPEVRGNDLEIYEPVTDPFGPAMTWGMFSVGHLELENFDKATELFHKSYSLYVRQPYKIWTEAQQGIGAVNFITGMGGFLQAVFFGYGGFRLHVEHLDFNPNLIPDTTEVKFVGIKYLEASLDFKYDATTVEINATTVGSFPLKVTLNDQTEYDLVEGQPLTFARQSGKITTTTDSGCPLPRDSTSKIVDVTSPTLGPPTAQPSEGPPVCAACKTSATALIVLGTLFIVMSLF